MSDGLGDVSAAEAALRSLMESVLSDINSAAAAERIATTFDGGPSAELRLRAGACRLLDLIRDCWNGR